MQQLKTDELKINYIFVVENVKVIGMINIFFHMHSAYTYTERFKYVCGCIFIYFIIVSCISWNKISILTA